MNNELQYAEIPLTASGIYPADIIIRTPPISGYTVQIPVKSPPSIWQRISASISRFLS